MLQSGKSLSLNSRRTFLANAANGAGMLALASLLRDDGPAGGLKPLRKRPRDPLAPRLGTFRFPKARGVHLYLSRGEPPDQIDLFDPKPQTERAQTGSRLPESMTKKRAVSRFLQKETARLMGCPPERFTKHGRLGYGIVRPSCPTLGHVRRRHVASSARMHTPRHSIHHPGQPVAQTPGRSLFGRPSMVGLGSTTASGRKSKNLPVFCRVGPGRPRAPSWRGPRTGRADFLPTTLSGGCCFAIKASLS